MDKQTQEAMVAAQQKFQQQDDVIASMQDDLRRALETLDEVTSSNIPVVGATTQEAQLQLRAAVRSELGSIFQPTDGWKTSHIIATAVVGAAAGAGVAYAVHHYKSKDKGGESPLDLDE